MAFICFILLMSLCKCESINRLMFGKEQNIIINHTIQNIIVNISNTSITCADNYTICNITCIDCRQSSINCSTLNTDCIINCISNNSCSKSLISAPYLKNGYNIYLKCIGYQSCADSIIVATDMNLFETFCDKHSCFNLIGQLDNSHTVLWHCYHGGCQFDYIAVPNVYQFHIDCNGNKTQPGQGGNIISTCWETTLIAPQAQLINISCIESYSCGNLELYPPGVEKLYIKSTGYNALYGIDIYYPTSQTFINITCIAMDINSYSCSYINIYGDEELILEDTHFNCVGTGCGGNFYIESKYGLSDINFTLNSMCLCGSVASCIGLYTVFDIIELWNIIGGGQDCNYSVQILKEPNVDSYNELLCVMNGYHCSSRETQSFCNNCSNNRYWYSDICCGNFISSLQTSFDYYYDIYNCTVPNHTANPTWYYPVIVLLLGFVVVCLGLIYCKNNWKKKQREKYQAMIHRQVRYSINGSDNTSSVTTSTPIKPPVYHDKIIQTIPNKGQSLLSHCNNDPVLLYKKCEIKNNGKQIQNDQDQQTTANNIVHY